MLTYYCPECWKIVNETDIVCPHCGFQLTEFHELDFEEKLLSSLKHSIPERKIMAAQILGNINSGKALIEFQNIIESGETNYYILRSILIATAKIDDPLRMTILQNAIHNASTLISELAKSLVQMVIEHKNIDTWDHHTG